MKIYEVITDDDTIRYIAADTLKEAVDRIGEGFKTIQDASDVMQMDGTKILDAMRDAGFSETQAMFIGTSALFMLETLTGGDDNVSGRDGDDKAVETGD